MNFSIKYNFMTFSVMFMYNMLWNIQQSLIQSHKPYIILLKSEQKTKLTSREYINV